VRRLIVALIAISGLTIALWSGVVVVPRAPTYSPEGGPHLFTLPASFFSDEQARKVLPACGGVGAAYLRGAATDERLVWLESTNGSRQEIAWPAGTSATFAPDLIIRDSSGRVVARSGDHPSGQCEYDGGIVVLDFGPQATLTP
jgi:hypothetical protein